MGASHAGKMFPWKLEGLLASFKTIYEEKERLCSYSAFSKRGTNGGLGCTAQY